MKSVVIKNLILQLAKKDRIHRESMLIRSIKIDVTIQRRKLKRYEDWRALKYTNKKKPPHLCEGFVCIAPLLGLEPRTP